MPNPTVVVATETGLSRYDISSGTWDATPITPEDSHVANSKIDELFCDEENGRLLVGYRGLGILDIASGGWQRYLEDDGLAWNSVDGITAVGTDIWAVGYKGISVVSADGIQMYNEGTGMPDESAEAIATASDETVWVGSDGGLLRFQQGKMSQFNNDNVDGFPAGRLSAVSLASDGSVWVASSSNKLCQFDPAQESCLSTHDGNRDYYLTDMATGADEDVYFSTYGGGIWAYDGSKWRNLLLQEDQLVGNFVEDFAESNDGKLWVATDLGIQRFEPGNVEASWETFPAGDGGPPSRWAQGVYVDPSSKVWFAHDSKRASSFDGSTWSRYGEEEGIIGSVNAIAFDKDGTPYIGTSEGLLIMGGALLTDADGLPNKVVRSLYADGDTIWIGTVDGLANFENGSVEVVLDSTSAGLPSDNISVIVKDGDDSLLLGTPNGLARYDGEQVVTLLEPKSISGILGESVQSVSSIAISPDGSIWVGTYAGVYHGDGETWEHFTTADGLPANNVNAVYVDSSGVVWVGAGFTRSGGGIARYIPGESVITESDPSEPAQESVEPAATVGETSYDENTGLPLIGDAEQVYSTDSVLNYWSNLEFIHVRDFYLAEMPKNDWLLDVDEDGNCRDDDRCMGWHGDYNDPETTTFFFLKGDKGYLTLNLISENGKINVIFMVNEPAD